MSQADFTFEIAREVRLDTDFDRHRVVISCETTEGKSIDLKVDFQTLEKIHEETQKRLESLYGQ